MVQINFFCCKHIADIFADFLVTLQTVANKILKFGEDLTNFALFTKSLQFSDCVDFITHIRLFFFAKNYEAIKRCSTRLMS